MYIVICSQPQQQTYTLYSNNLLLLTSEITGVGQFCISCGLPKRKNPLPVGQVASSWQLPVAIGGAGPSTQ